MIDTLAAAARHIGGTLRGEDRAFAGISTDTRSLGDGELFFALQGPNFDGHDYAGAAVARGAAGAVVARGVPDDIAQIVVDDTRLALGRFGAAWRGQQDATVVGVTGSNGKTTLKELIRACLAQEASTLATEGNLNNDIGVPLMLARIERGHRFAVLEMGANHAGEIAYLASLARPDVVVITNAGAAHLEGFGSIEGVAKAKGEILQNAERPSFAVLNADDAYFSYWAPLVEDIRMLKFGFSDDADVRATAIEVGAQSSSFRLVLPGTELDVTLPLPGEHNVRNACAAAAVACALDIDPQKIRAGLETAAPIGGRLHPLLAIRGATLFDDSYNANPLSVIAAARFLASLPGESWLVLGDMYELGDEAAAMHEEVGEAAMSCGIDRLFALGDLSRHTVAGFGENAAWFGDFDALVRQLSADISASVNVLVKGSRSMHMERVVEALRDVEPARKEA